jgi:hypothetical protein
MGSRKRGVHLNDLPSHIARSITDMELPVSGKQVRPSAGPRFSAPVRIHVHSIRGRLADSDGISGKAAIDGLVKGGILADDSPKEVSNVSFSQEKNKEEKTIITITLENSNAN